MSSNPAMGDGNVISVLLVDDIPETRENIKKLLAFESDFKVVGSVGTGREAVAKAKELMPDIIIMDINMPDMDGIQATAEVTKVVPTTAVIMMSVQNDPDYLRKAMLAGARDFLTKPIGPDELYNTIRTVYQRNRPIADQYRQLQEGVPLELRRTAGSAGSSGGAGERAGHVIVVYSPQGGAGTTTIATSLASGLMKKGIRVLLIDADTQFGDIGVFLKLQSQTTLVDMAQQADDLDSEFFDNVIATHDSGLKVLLGPPRPEFGDEVEANPAALTQIVKKVSSNYDFIIIDTASHLSEMLLSVMDLAEKIVLVATPTLMGVKNTRFVLELFDKLNYNANKTALVLNRTEDDNARNRVTVPTEAIERHLKTQVQAKIPNNEAIIMGAVNKGVPVIASQKDRGKSPIRELIELSEHLYSELMADEEPDFPEEEPAPKRKLGLGLFGNKN